MVACSTTLVFSILMSDAKSYLNRPSIPFAAKVFVASIHAEGTLAHHAINEELRVARGLPSDADHDPSRLPPVSYQKAADALNGGASTGTAASKYSVATHFDWAVGSKSKGGQNLAPPPQKFLKARRPLSHLRSIAPLSSLLLDAEVGAGPAERFFLGLDAFAALQYEDDLPREELQRRGFAVATRVVAESWRAWGAELQVTGRSLPPRLIREDEDLSPVELQRMVDVAAGCHWWPDAAESWARGRRCDGWIVDSSDVELQFPNNAVLWVLQHAVSFRRLFPHVPLAPHFGLELLGLALSSRAEGMPWANTAITRRPRTALVSDLCVELLPLTKRLPPVQEVASLIRGLDIVRPAGDADLVAEVLLDARQAVIDWLQSYSIEASEVDTLLSEVLERRPRMSIEDECLQRR